MSAPSLVAAAGASGLAELCFDDGSVLRALPVVPLVDDEAVVVALPYSAASAARALQARPRAVLACWDPRVAAAGWAPVAAEVAVTVEPDPTGQWSRTPLLGQLLRKHPPARRHLDTPLLRKEHWWAVPRLLVRVDRVHERWGVRGRGGDGDAVLARLSGSGWRVDTAAVEGWASPTPRVRLDDEAAPGQGERAVLAATWFDDADLDPLGHAAVSGVLRDGRLEVAERHGEPRVPRPTLWRRVREESRLSRRCRRELEAW